jgi:hypothetical protein
MKLLSWRILTHLPSRLRYFLTHRLWGKFVIVTNLYYCSYKRYFPLRRQLFSLLCCQLNYMQILGLNSKRLWTKSVLALNLRTDRNCLRLSLPAKLSILRIQNIFLCILLTFTISRNILNEHWYYLYLYLIVLFYLRSYVFFRKHANLDVEWVVRVEINGSVFWIR